MELLTITLIIILGIIAGTITGLIPGIHINLVATTILINITILLNYFNLQQIIIFILSMGITHTFIDFIPSILFGVPSSDTALSILPGHKLVLEGKAYKAIYLSSIGSLYGIIFTLLITPIFFFGLQATYEFVKKYIPYFLIFTIIILILSEPKLNNKFWALIITLFAGSFGMLILNTNLISDPLLILFTGTFGISTIIHSLNQNENSLPEQNYKINDFKLSTNFFKAILIGGTTSSLCSITPGIGNAQAATISALFFKKITSELFIVVISTINTINFALSIITFYLIEKARNGSIVVISQIIETLTFQDLKTYLTTITIVGLIAFFLTLALGKKLIKTISKLNIKKINIYLLLFLLTTIYLLTNIYGLLILISSSFLGILTISLGIRRIHLMSILLIPVIINLL